MAISQFKVLPTPPDVSGVWGGSRFIVKLVADGWYELGRRRFAGQTGLGGLMEAGYAS